MRYKEKNIINKSYKPKVTQAYLFHREGGR
nr:MAG TPA: hypothetical protein [Crassvirales sp.]